MKIIHLTDPHLVRPGRPLYGSDPQRRLLSAVESINKRHADADFVLLTGDLTDAGDAAAYEALKDILGRLAVPCHMILGNHDSREAYFAVFRDAPRTAEGFAQSAVDTLEGCFILLDSLKPGSHAGELCPDRLAWLERCLGERAGTPVFVAVHHPPFALGIPTMDRIQLADSEALRALLERHGRVRHLFHGHVHRPVSGTWHSIPFSTLPATNHQVALQFHLTDATPGSTEPPQYAVVLIDRTTTVIHLCNYLGEGSIFRIGDPLAAAAETPDELPEFRL